jgi:hypothetical protein
MASASNSPVSDAGSAKSLKEKDETKAEAGMSDKETDAKAKRSLESSDTNDDEEKRATRKKTRVDYNEDKKQDNKEKPKEPKKEEGDEEEEEDDDEIQDVTPADIKGKTEEVERSGKSTSDDLMGLPMEPTGLEGAGIYRTNCDRIPKIRSYSQLSHSLQWSIFSFSKPCSVRQDDPSRGGLLP